MIRIVLGAMIEAPGWILLALRFTGVLDGEWPWFVGGAAVLLGLFGVLEGALGWCIVRALGVNTSA